jgi:putative copper resistance protein D
MSEALVLCRFAHFAATMALFGLCFFCAALAPAGLFERLGRPIARIKATALAVAVVTLALWLMIEGGEMGDGWRDAIDPAIVFSVLQDTAFGHVWTARLMIAAVLIAVVLWPRKSRALEAVFAGLFLASLGLVGHAAMRDGAPGLLERANQALHLLAGGFWLGCLAPLLLCLPRLNDEVRKHETGVALRRFSGLGHLAVAAVLLTGVVNTMMILKRVPDEASSPYQAMLAAKILVVGAMVVLALYNRYALVPRLGLYESALPALARNTWIELALGGIVLALVSTFATLNPM